MLYVYIKYVALVRVHNSRKIVIGRLKLPMELWCGSDGAAFASKLAVCLITSTPPLTGLKPAYDENCLGIKCA